MSKKFVLGSSLIDFSWDFRSVETGLSLVQYFECTLSGHGASNKGYSEGLFALACKKRSLSEAWERWWLNHFPLFEIDNLPQPKSSNGFAAHKRIELALRASRLELIERRDVILSWQKPGTWKRLGEDSVLRFIDLFIERVTASKAWCVEFYLIRSSFGTTTVIGLLVHKGGGIIFDSTSTDGRINLGLLLKLVFSLLRSIPFINIDNLDLKVELPENGIPKDHLNFYFNKENAKAFDLHRFHSGVGKSLINDFHGVDSVKLIDKAGFPALAYSYHSDWDDISWGKRSLHANGWPHPIA